MDFTLRERDSCRGAKGNHDVGHLSEDVEDPLMSEPSQLKWALAEIGTHCKGFIGGLGQPHTEPGFSRILR